MELAFSHITCNWTHVVHSNWKPIIDGKLPQLEEGSQESTLISPKLVTLLALLLSFTTKLFLVHLLGHYNTRRRYFEPQASEVRTYSAQIGNDSGSKTNLKDAVLTDQVPDYIASVAMALLDPMSLSYSSDIAMHDYGRPLFSSIVSVFITRLFFYILAYYVFMYYSSENFATPMDFIERRFNSKLLTVICSFILFMSEMLFVILQVNSLTRSLTILGESYHFWLMISCVMILIFTQFGSANLLRMGLLLFASSLFTFFWTAMELRAKFTSKLVAANLINSSSDPYEGTDFTIDEAMADHGGSVIKVFLYDTSIACCLLAMPFLHFSFRFSQVNYMIVQVVEIKQRRKRLFMRAFLLNLTLHMCHLFMLRAVLALRRQEGCDPILTGKVCHFSVIEESFKHSDTLQVLYLVNRLHLFGWIGALRIIAIAYGATASWIKNFLKLCLVGQRWAVMDRWRRQNGRIMFRDCNVINLDRLLFTTLLVILIIAVYFICIDYGVWDPSLRWLQVMHYLLLDFRFLFFVIPTILGLCFWKFTLSHLYIVTGVLLATYLYIVLWCDRIDANILQYKMMVPIFLQNSARMRRNCKISEKLRPIINVGKRSTDHEIVHMIDLDAFYLTAIISACIMAAALCSINGKPCVLRSPFFSIVDAGYGTLTNSLRAEFHNRFRTLSRAIRAFGGDRTSELMSLLRSTKVERETVAECFDKSNLHSDIERRVSLSPEARKRPRVERIRNEQQSMLKSDAIVSGLNKVVKEHQEIRKRRKNKL